MQRREFLTRVGLAGGALALGRFDAVQAADTSGYKSLVCVFLLGGNDAFNMVVPRSAAEYRVYAAARQNLAVPASALLPITPLTSDGAQYGLHPAMRELQTLFQSGRAAIVANVGPLVQPATKAEIAARSVPLPPQLFSHNDQQDQWQSLRGLANFTTGWAGRVADALEAQLASQRVPLNISLAGTLPWQAATRASGYAVGDQGPVTYLTLESAVPGGIARRRAFEALVASRQPTPYGRALNRAHERALALASLTQQALTRAPRLATTFPDTPLGRQLAMVARLISVRDELAMRRQIFLVAIGGFDTHDAQNELQPGLLGGVSAALASFDAALR
ncbi:MAG: DUF1501 domain-containing protein, partial [Steroidobacteraceae bacterium]|nr:DUF1501 domain-containing protein [Steroidobacteraceae bacterium]